jgi:hypothetical protein
MFFGTDKIRFGVTSVRFPGETRSYDRFTRALREITGSSPASFIETGRKEADPLLPDASPPGIRAAYGAERTAKNRSQSVRPIPFHSPMWRCAAAM